MEGILRRKSLGAMKQRDGSVHDLAIIVDTHMAIEKYQPESARNILEVLVGSDSSKGRSN